MLDEFIVPPSERIFPPRMLLCAADIAPYCRARYPRRDVHPVKHLNPGEFCYFNLKSGRIRIVKRKTSVWVLDESNPGFARRVR